MTTQELVNTLNRYNSRCKVKSIPRKLTKIGLGKTTKIQNISKNELNQAEKLQNESIDELKMIARLRRIKKIEKLTKEDLIISLLKSESSPAERNYMKHFNNNNTDDNDTYDDKRRGKISDIRMILSRLWNIADINNRKKIKRELYEIEKKKNLSNKKKEKIFNQLLELVNTIDKKETYQCHDRDDLDYYGIRGKGILFTSDEDDDDNYYKPILVKSFFKSNYK